jgi:mono/diheme cytochrome c family protein
MGSAMSAALAATLLLAACGGGSGGGNAGAAAPAPAPAPSPAPGPSPSPAPAPSPGPSPSPSPSPSPAPAPAPAPPPSAQVLRGAVLYRDHCSSCHGSEPENGTQGIYKGLTANVIEAAYGRVMVMRQFSNLFSAANNDDVAAFIEYRVDPRP